MGRSIRDNNRVNVWLTAAFRLVGGKSLYPLLCLYLIHYLPLAQGASHASPLRMLNTLKCPSIATQSHSPMNSFLLDLKFALRSLARSPLFTFVAIASLALGLGANTAIFSLMDQILLRPLPVPHPEQLVLLDWDGTFSGRISGDHAFAYPMYLALRDKNPGVFSGLIARARYSADLGLNGVAERINAELVSGSYFQVLGVNAVLGRAFTPADNATPGGHPVVVLSYAYWQKRFNGKPSVLNQKVLLNGHPMTVIGIVPRSFTGVEFGVTSEVFVPMVMKAQVTPTWDDLAEPASLWLNIIGRLSPGATREQAQAAMTVVYRQQNAEDLKYRKSASPRFRKRFVQNSLKLLDVAEGLSELRQKTATPLRVLTALVGTLLLVACVNLASLFIARASARRREVAIRLSLGASKSAVVRLVLIESLLLSLVGACFGLLVAAWCGSLLIQLMPGDNIGLILSTSPDLRVLLYALLLAVVTGLLFGLAPALQSVQPDIAPTLKAEAGNVTADVARVGFRKALLIGQIAMSLLLLIGAGLFARSLYRLLSTDAGFKAENLIQFAVDPSLQGYSPARIRQFFTDVERQIASIPGVSKVSSAENPLIQGDRSASSVEVEGYHAKEAEDMNVDRDAVGPAFLSTMGVPLRLGRDLSDRDLHGAAEVAVVNETFAHYFFPHQSPLGSHLTFPGSKSSPIEIVGVCKDIKTEDLRQKPRRLVLLPNQQDENPAYVMFYVRTTRDPASLINTIRSEVRRLDSSLPIYDLKTMTTQIDQTHFVERAIAILSLSFGLLATLLASIGLYGVMAFSVSRRTRELGIRIALGAPQGSVLWLVMREVVVLAAIGILVAAPFCFGLGKLVASQLFEMKAYDPLTFAAATLCIALVCALSGFLPAWRASRIDPVTALHYE